MLGGSTPRAAYVISSSSFAIDSGRSYRSTKRSVCYAVSYTTTVVYGGPAQHPTLIVPSPRPEQHRPFVVVDGDRATWNVRFNDPHVSRLHAKLRRRDAAVWLEDLGSTGGTHVNGRRIAAGVRVLAGDELSFATVRCMLRPGADELAKDTQELPVAIDHSQAPILSDRQLEVLRLVHHGATNPEIASALGVAPRTVKAHEGIFSRLEVRNRTAAVVAAARLGLFDA